MAHQRRLRQRWSQPALARRSFENAASPPLFLRSIDGRAKVQASTWEKSLVKDVDILPSPLSARASTPRSRDRRRSLDGLLEPHNARIPKRQEDEVRW